MRAQDKVRILWERDKAGLEDVNIRARNGLGDCGGFGKIGDHDCFFSVNMVVKNDGFGSVCSSDDDIACVEIVEVFSDVYDRGQVVCVRGPVTGGIAPDSLESGF